MQQLPRGLWRCSLAADLGFEAKPPDMPMLNQQMLRSPLASERVRYVGEPIAVVLAESREAAFDAAELVYVDYEPLDPLLDPHEAAKDETLLFPDAGTNTAFALPSSGEDLFAHCEVVVDLEMINPRLSVAPLEPRAGLASYSTETGRLTYWACTQFPHRSRDGLVGATGLEVDQVHVITPDVGGGFGGKNANYPEDFAIAKASVHLGRPVRWTETRTESMVGIAHARALSYTVRIGGSRSGDISSYKCEVLQESGAYPAIGSVLPMFVKIMATGVYDIPNVDVVATSVVTNTAPIGAYRGAGRPEATLALERAVDAFAAEIRMDPAEVRRRNFIPPESFPFKTPTGADMDSGDYAAALDAVMEAADYAGLRAEQARRLGDPSAPLLGIGWSAYVEIANPMGASEFGSVEVRPDGSALVLTGSSNHGQGHHTAFAQIAADVTGIPFDKIEVRHGDTDEVKRGGGTGGSRSLQVGGVAVNEAAVAVVEMAKDAAADILEAARADIVLDIDAGTFAVTGTPARSLSWAEIVAHTQAEDETSGLMAETDFQPPAATFPFGVHLSVVEIDRETGQVTPTRHICCDDAGNLVNPHHRRRSGPRRRRLRDRAGPHGGVHLRRRREPADRQLHGLRLRFSRRTPQFRATRDGDTNGSKSAGCEGHRRGRHHRCHAGGAERRRRRLVSSGRAAHRDPLHLRAGMAAPQGSLISAARTRTITPRTSRVKIRPCSPGSTR